MMFVQGKDGKYCCQCPMTGKMMYFDCATCKCKWCDDNTEVCFKKCEKECAKDCGTGCTTSTTTTTTKDTIGGSKA